MGYDITGIVVIAMPVTFIKRSARVLELLFPNRHSKGKSEKSAFFNKKPERAGRSGGGLLALGGPI